MQEIISYLKEEGFSPINRVCGGDISSGSYEIDEQYGCVRLLVSEKERMRILPKISRKGWFTNIYLHEINIYLTQQDRDFSPLNKWKYK